MLLRSMRNGFLSAIFLGLLVLGAVGLIFSDWNGMFHGSGLGKTDIATVDGTPIKIAEFNSRLTRILRQQNIPESAAYQMGYVNNVLNGEIYDILMRKDAAKLGIRVEDRIVAEQIKSLIAPMKTGTMTDADALKRFLEMQGMNEKQLVSLLRNDVTSQILKTTIASADYVPDALIADLAAAKGIARTMEVAFIPNSSWKIKAQPADAELEAYYKDRTMGYMNPETRDVTVAVLDTSKLKKPTVSDADIKAFYDENQDNFALAQSAEVEQSLIADEAKAKQVADAVRSGKSMKDAVKQATGDEKSYQGKNSFAKDGLPENISGPVFAAKTGDVIGPIKSAFGYHVIQLVGMKEAQTASLNSVKDKIRKEMEDEKSSNSVFDVTNDIEDRLANNEGYDSLAKEYPLTITSFKALQSNAKSEKSDWSEKEFQTLLNKAFSLKDKTPSELADLSPSKLYSVRVDNIVPAKAKPFAEVKTDLLKKWTADNQAQNNLINAQKQVDDLITGKIKFETLNPKKLSSVTATGNEGLAKDVTPRFMSAEQGKFIMAISNEKDGIYIGRVTSVTLPQNAKPSEEERKMLEANASTANYMAYMESLQTKYHVSINDALLARTYSKQPDNTTQ